MNTERVRDCDLTSKDTRRSQLIEGKEKFSLRGKRTNRHRKNPKPVIVNTPNALLSGIGPVRLHVGIVCANGNTFLHAMLENIRLLTLQWIQSRSKTSLQTNLEDVVRKCNANDFAVKHMDVDMEFECLKESMPNMSFDIVSPDDYESVVERSIRTAKEGVCCLVQQLPRRCTPLLMVKRIVWVAVRNLNQFPVENGLSDEHSPLT